MVPSARLELALQKGTDFKSVVSTNFTTRAHSLEVFILLFLYNSTPFHDQLNNAVANCF